MFSALLALSTSLPAMYRREMPPPLNEKRCSPDTVGVNVPVQRADQVPDRPAGVPVTCTVGSTRVIAGVPLRSGEAKYSAVRPVPPPEAGVSVAVSTSGGSFVPAVPAAYVTETLAPARARMPSSGVTVLDGTTVAEPPPV